MADVEFRRPYGGARTLSLPDSMELCPVCWWADDGQDSEDAAEARVSVHGELSLREARLHYQHCGAAHPGFVRCVRTALPEEEKFFGPVPEWSSAPFCMRQSSRMAQFEPTCHVSRYIWRDPCEPLDFARRTHFSYKTANVVPEKHIGAPV